MELQYELLSPTARWPGDPHGIAAAISSQGPFELAITVDGDRLLVETPDQALHSTVRMAPYEAQRYETLRDSQEYQLRMTDRDRDTALPFTRQLTITTGPGADGDPARQALFHVTVTDGIWWLMGGFLIDPYRHTIWGWRRWRPDMPLAAHAEETLAAGAGVAQGGTP